MDGGSAIGKLVMQMRFSWEWELDSHNTFRIGNSITHKSRGLQNPRIWGSEELCGGIRVLIMRKSGILI